MQGSGGYILLNSTLPAHHKRGFAFKPVSAVMSTKFDRTIYANDIGADIVVTKEGWDARGRRVAVQREVWPDIAANGDGLHNVSFAGGEFRGRFLTGLSVSLYWRYNHTLNPDGTAAPGGIVYQPAQVYFDDFVYETKVLY